MARLFGTDGVRGLANDLLTPALAVQLGEAAARVLTKDTSAARSSRSGRPRAIVGRDTRASGEFLDHAISAGLASSGWDGGPLMPATWAVIAVAMANAHDFDG